MSGEWPKKLKDSFKDKWFSNPFLPGVIQKFGRVTGGGGIPYLKMRRLPERDRKPRPRSSLEDPNWYLSSGAYFLEFRQWISDV